MTNVFSRRLNSPQSLDRLQSILEKMMNRLEQFLGKACGGCRLCRYARDNPTTVIGKIMVWHGKWCPAWKAQQKIEDERQQEAKIERNLLKELSKKW
ncbi:MAG: hypothetical protein ABSH41_01420 [Syntrophobacteraceae bacterium]